MADEKKSAKVMEFFSKYGEKLALAVALLALIGYALKAYAFSAPDTSVGEIDDKVRRLKNEQSRAHPEHKAPEVRNWQADAVGEWGQVIATPRGADNWGASLMTHVEEKTTAVVIKKANIALLPAVRWGGAEVAIDSVTVSWAFTDFTKDEKTKGAKAGMEYAAITHFTLERETNGSGKWEVLEKTIPAATLTYKDTKIEPKQKYAYRVTAWSTEKAYLEHGGKPDPTYGGQPNPEGRGNTAVGAPVQTMGLWNLVFSSPSKPEGAEKGMVFVKIEKFEKNHGKIEAKRIHYEGDRIGWWPEGQGAEPVSTHTISLPGGKSIKADLNSEATLTKIEPTTLVVDVKKCKQIFDRGTGTKTGCETITEKRNFSTFEIVYKDNEGLHKLYLPNPGDLNQLCPEHGGRSTAAAPAPGTPASDAAKAKREADAEKLYQEADKAEPTSKAKAAELLTKLLSTFADTEFVIQRKRVIEERVAALKQK